MAGETPDRAQQRNSSDVNGSAASGERAVDPRLAVSRESEPRTESGEREPRTESREGEPRTDQATAVFSTAGLRLGDAGAEPEREPEAEVRAEGEPERAPEPEGGTAAAEGGQESSGDAEGGQDVPGDAEGGESGDATGDEAGGGAEDARLRAAVAAWVAGESAEPTESAESAESAGEGDAAEASEGAEAEGEGGDVAGAEQDEAEPEADARTEPEPEAAVDTDAEPEAVLEPVSEPAAAPEPVADADPGTDAEPEAATADGKRDADVEDSGAEAEPPLDQATAVFKTLPPPVDQPTAMFRTVRPDAEPDAKSDASADAKSAPADAQPASEPADAKSEPADAKTDAEPDAKTDAKPEAGTDAGPGKGVRPESPAERTSKFIALKPLDEPARAPEQPAAPKADPTRAPEPEPAAAPEQPAVASAPSAVNAGPERTAQQPLPPKAPLDLLAELTNRPPPPETPMRTVGRRIKIWTPLVLLLAVVFAVAQAVRPLPTPKLSLTAQETVSFEGDKPQIPWPDQGQAALDVEGIGSFGTSGEQKPVPIASIAKVMTAYVILKEHPIKGDGKGVTIPVDKKAEEHWVSGQAEKESVVDVKEGEKLSEYEAIQSLMLPSANNVAKLLARWDSNGDEKAFVQKMNDAAKDLGMKNTTFTDASGLDKTTVSTAEDLVKLGRAAMEIPVFKEIVGQPSYKPANGRGDTSNGRDGTTWYNFNSLVPTVAVGIKTGTTTAAGGNLLFSSRKTVDGKEQIVIGAALAQFAKHTGANIDEVNANSRKLMEAAEAALISKTVVKKGDVVGQVDDGFGGTTPVVATKDVKAVGWPGLTVKLAFAEDKGKKIPNTAKAGTQVGVLTVGDGKGAAVTVPVALQSDLEEPGFGAKLTRIL
ncbi:D-alanyl-D-alanine carboxypeptidase [Streptomyces mesophilus]|uniref:D-alanyl-D-alanine carboxypeptidase n=1 Tax=Streptomyces mesophilus TaxID=1775132 RepID=UPI00332561AE